MKIELNTTNFKFRWHIADERLNVIKPLLDLLGEPESTEVKLSFWDKFKLFWVTLWAKLRRKKVKVRVNIDDEILGVGSKMI